MKPRDDSNMPAEYADYKPHNTFDSKKAGPWVFVTSHNFKQFKGRGHTLDQASNSLNNQLMDWENRNPGFLQKAENERNEAGLECLCGHKLKKRSLGFWKAQAEGKVSRIKKDKENL